MTAPEVLDDDVLEGASVLVARPFLRWPGGKRWLLDAAPDLFGSSQRRLLDPFLGGGAFLFQITHQSALVGDINPELITTYQAVRRDPRGVWRALKHHASMHSRQYYEIQRTDRPATSIEAAARFIYLNHTSFNGLHRVNKLGQFNVPMGDRSVRTTFEELYSASVHLSRVELICADFEVICRKAGVGDLLVLDPPYTVKHDHNGFVRYNEKIFTWADQERLASEARRARNAGAEVVITNANHESVLELYPQSEFSRTPVDRFSRVSAKSAGRTECTEAVFVGTPL